MKKISLLLLGFLAGLSFANLHAETAQARLFCYSVRVHGATGTGGATLDLTTSPNIINDELAPYFSTRTHYCAFVLDDGSFPIEGTMYLDAPLGLDANDDGFDDFFDTTRGVAITSTAGTFNTGFSTGTVTAQWIRSAGSKNGTCVLSLTDNSFGYLGTFNHSFEILEYKGVLTYTPAATNVTGSLSLTRAGSALETLAGPAQFNKSPTIPADELELQAGGWTNAASQALTFVVATVDRDLIRQTNYYGVVLFDDGEPATADADYSLWVLSLDDANDSDHDGVPNFSDAPAGGAARKPV
ncbi:MAG: hypothetical protein EPO07_18810, partial [Verrucomicrobia bacterium]